MTKTGSGTLILSGNNSYSGGTTIAAGTLQLGNDGASGWIGGTVADNGTLAFDRCDVSTFAGAISGTGTLVQLGSGTTALTADNSYTGGTTISAGTLQLGDGGTSGSIVGNVTNNGTLAFDRADTFTFGGAISGMGAVNQIGPGTTVLTADNSYSGPTNVEVGTLAAGAPDVFSPNSVHGIAPGATLDLAGFDQTVAGVNNAGTIEMHGAGPGTTLTVDGNYVGNNGTIGLNSFLGTNGSPSDRLVLNGGTATGSTVLRISNAGGPGAETRADGIEVVSAINGGTTAPDAFSLGGQEVRGGAFDYRLFQGGVRCDDPQNWFLRSDFTIPPSPLPPGSPP